ncbi:hypothetical protein AgCh_017412 [Apium graveolens]
MFRCAKSTSSVPMFPTSETDIPSIFFLWCLPFIWHSMLPLLVVKVVVIITLPLQVARVIMISKPASRVSMPTVSSVTSSSSMPFPMPVLLECRVMYFSDKKKGYQLTILPKIALPIQLRQNHSVGGVPHASAYQNKRIQNWDDICTLFASDRAIGDGAEQYEESATAMELENEVVSTAETSSGELNKRQKRNRLADAVTSFAESFKEYASKVKEPPRPTCKEIYEVVSTVDKITDSDAMRAVKRFVNGQVDEFEMLKSLPDDKKLG